LRLGRHVVLIAVLAVGCSSATPSAAPTSPDGAPPTATSTETGSPTEPGPGETTAPADDAASVQELIAADLAAGVIDAPTSLLYRAYALFDDEQLPERYVGNLPGSDEHLFNEIARAEPTLPPAIVEALIPFTVRPHDPRSIHAPDGSLAAAVQLATTSAQSTIVCQPDGWAHLTSPKGFKVWATCGTYDDAEFDDSNYDQRVRQAYAALERVWDAEVALMGRPIPDVTASMSPAKVVAAGGDGSIDFYLVQRWQCIRREGVCRSLRGPNESPSPDDPPGWAGESVFYPGMAPPAEPRSGAAGVRTSSGYLLIDRRVKDLEATLAHELAHVIGFAYNEEGDAVGRGYHWFVEAFAEWAAWRFAPTDRGSPHVNFQWFQSEPDVPLNQSQATGARHGYAAWVWPLFMSIEPGGDHNIKAAWEAVRGKPGAQWDAALNGVVSFGTRFHEFAVQNLNLDLGERLDPWSKVAKDAGFPHDQPIYQKYHQIEGRPAGEPAVEWDVTLPHLTAEYAYFAFEETVQAIGIDLTRVFAGPVRAEAVYSLADGSGWERRELVADETILCDTVEGDISEMYLVLSNDSLTENGSDEVRIRPIAEPCEAGPGFVIISRTESGTYTNHRGNEVQVDMVDTATITFDLVPSGEGMFVAETSTITWRYSSVETEQRNGCPSGFVTTSEGGGKYTGTGGPTVTLGLESDGTIFGGQLNEEAYTISAISPTAEMAEDDPRGNYSFTIDLCGEIISGPGWLPYTPIYLASGHIPESGGAYEGTATRTVQPLFGQGLPITETLTWSFLLE
jgi:hypothetical protein